MNLHPCPLCGESKGYDSGPHFFTGTSRLYCRACEKCVALVTGKNSDDAAWNVAAAHAQGLRERIAELERDNANLKTVMVAAAEEIHAHWDSHCDADGYGPQNLMRRLEEGIPSEYGYTAGAFAAQQKRIAELEAQRQWQPIETAPEGVMLQFADMNATEAKWWTFSGWRHSGLRGNSVQMPDGTARSATHWMPLPPPPVERAHGIEEVKR